MTDETLHRPRLTPKGERTRARIVAAAATLIHERGVAGTTFEDVRTAAEVSGYALAATGEPGQVPPTRRHAAAT